MYVYLFCVREQPYNHFAVLLKPLRAMNEASVKLYNVCSY